MLSRFVQAERFMKLRALGLLFLALLLTRLQLVRPRNPRAQDVSLGVVSWGPPAPGITESLKK